MEISQHIALAAINATLDSATKKNDRESAQQYLQDLKGQEVCLEMMMHILTTDGPEHNDWNRQLALSIIDDWLKGWWNRIPEEAQLFIRQQCVKLLASTALGNSRGLRTKLAVILCNIAERQYPQQWPSFLDDVLSLWENTSQPAQREICVMTLEFLIQDCVDGDFNTSLPSLRRQDILTGLRERLSALLRTTYGFLVQCATQLQNRFGHVNEAQECKALGVATLRLVTALASFAKSSELCAAPHDMFRLTLQLLSLDAVQTEAVNLFYVISSQKFEATNIMELLEAVVNTPVTTLPSILGDSIAFQRVYAEAVHQLLVNHSTILLEERHLNRPNVVQTLGSYMTLMSQLLNQPSRRLAADVLGCWIRLSRDKALLHLPWAGDVIALVLRVYCQKTLRVRWDPVTDSPESPEDQEDFDDLEEYNEFRNNFSCQYRVLAEAAAERFPEVTARFLLEEVQSLLASSVQQSDMILKGRDAAANTEVARRWEALHVVWGVVFKHIRPQLLSGANADDGRATGMAVHSLLISALEGMLQWDPSRHVTDSALLHVLHMQRAKIVTDTAPLLNFSSQHLMFAVQLLFNSYCAGEHPGASPSPEHVRRNRSVSAAIAQLCDSCIAQIIQHEQVATAVVHQLVAWLGSHDVNRDDQSSFREALVAIADKVPDAEGRANVMSAALGAYLQSLRVMADSTFSNPTTLLQTCYVENCASANRHAQSQPRTLDSLWFALGSLLSATRRITPPQLPLGTWTHALTIGQAELNKSFTFSAVWQDVLPALATISKCLHGVWEPSFRTAVQVQQPHLADLYLPSPDTVRLKAWEGTDKETAAPQGGAQSPVDHVRSGLERCRQQLYHLLGQSCQHIAFYTSSQRQVFLRELISSAKYMENSHLCYLLRRFVEPFVLHAPPCYYSDVSVFLQALLPDTLTRLTVAWQEVPAAMRTWEQTVYCFCSLPEAASYAGQGPESLEMVRQAEVVDMSRAVGEMLATLGLCRGFLCDPAALTAAASPTNAEASSSLPASKAKGAVQAKLDKKHKSGVTPLKTWTIESENDSDESRMAQKQARRAALRELVFGMQSAVTEPFLKSVVALLCVPDSMVCRIGVQLARSALLAAQTDARLVPIVGRDCFAAALSVLLQQGSWTSGVEWDLIDFLQECYCTFVLGLELDPGLTLTEAAQAAKRDSRQRRQAELQLPADMLTEAGVPPGERAALHPQLLGCSNKKKRRDYFKDFLTPLISRYAASRQHGGDTTAAPDSVFSKKMSAVLDIRTRLSKTNSSKNKTAPLLESKDSDNFSLASLFKEDSL